MTEKFATLRAKMTPESQARANEKAHAMLPTLTTDSVKGSLCEPLVGNDHSKVTCLLLIGSGLSPNSSLMQHIFEFTKNEGAGFQ